GIIYKTTLRLAATAIAATLAAGTTAASAETYAVIVKTVNDVFSAPVKEGCEKAAKDLGVECYYIGPSEVNEAQQLQVINDVLTKGVDGIAVSATNPKSVARLLEKAKAAGIPIVTFDGDLLKED
ncbi:MAG: sugar ABC transporter substrate-binding protein, partial [Mesorhizobium sp.]